MNSTLTISHLTKSFTMHHQGGVNLSVFDDITLSVAPGECLILQGESGLGKSTLLRCLYGNYLTDSGEILLQIEGKKINMCSLPDRDLIRLRRENIAYVSQFLRVIPRVSTLQIVMEPLLTSGFTECKAREKSSSLLERLHIPEHLWSLSPTTFSGGEQQRVNIAREFTAVKPLMLLDEATASLDEKNRAIVIQLIHEAKQEGAAIIGIFHDESTRKQVADKVFDLKTRAYL